MSRLTRGRGRMGRLLGVAVVLVALGATAVFANLTNSGFDAGDGNLVKNDEAFDWENAPNFASSIDKTQGTGDNAFGNGTSEDDPVPTVKFDSIPPNKSDITRFYKAHETVGNQTFLYLAWQRQNVPSGTTNFDFELNQSMALSSNGQTPVRTAGDILIKYDLSSGGTSVGLGYHKWVTSGSSAGAVCEANSKFPCWDKLHTITGSNFEASVWRGPGTTTDPIAPNAPRSLDPFTFGEVAVDLVGAGILAAGDCTGFAQSYLKSRASDSFNSAIKDFSPALPANINTCQPQTIKLKKVDPENNPLSGAVMQLFKDVNGNGTLQIGTDTQVGQDCTTGADGIGDCVFVIPGISASNGTYIGHEKTPPPGYTTSAPDVAQTVTIGNTSPTFTLTFTDSLAPGQINIHKTDDSTVPNPLQGVVFELYTNVAPTAGPRGAGDVTTGQTCTTDVAGDCSFTGVAPGDYWVVEKTGKPGHDPAPDEAVTVDVGTAPGQGDTVNLTIENPRQHRVVVLVCHEGTDSLVSSDVTLDGTTKVSRPGTGLTAAQQKALCDTGGASFGNISGHPTKTPSVTIGKVAGVDHP